MTRFQVVANAVAALSEINEASASGRPLIEMNAQTINKLLTALNECTEWGQVRMMWRTNCANGIEH